MADEVTTATPMTLPPGFTMEDFARLLGASITEGINKTQRKKIPFGLYDPKSAFQPDKRKTKKLTRDAYQNGYRMDPGKLFNAEIDLLNRIHRPGRYLDRTIEVLLRDTGNGEETIELRYKNKTIDQRMELRNKIRNLQDMLQQIVDEQDRIEGKEAKSTEPKQARENFASASTREARLAAQQREQREQD